MTANNLKVEIGPERIVLTDGLQPFMFRTSKGTLVAQAQLSFPPNYIQPERNAYPGIPGNVVSRDGGKSWERWMPQATQGLGPTHEGAALELSDGTILIVQWIADGPSSAGDWMGKNWKSRDDFETVEGPMPMRVHLPQARCGFDDGGRPYSGLTFHRTVLELPGGDLLATAYCLGSSRVDLQACKLEYSIVSPK